MNAEQEEHRHRCEVRFVLAMRAQSRSRAHEYLLGVERKGRNASRLRADCVEQWGKGNRGDSGDWR